MTGQHGEIQTTLRHIQFMDKIEIKQNLKSKEEVEKNHSPIHLFHECQKLNQNFKEPAAQTPVRTAARDPLFFSTLRGHLTHMNLHTETNRMNLLKRTAADKQWDSYVYLRS